MTSPSAAPDVSVIVVSFNTRDVLHECLQSLLKEVSAFGHEVFVVDNASTDGSAAMVRDAFPQVCLIESKTNLGFGAANNLALESARGRYIVLLNSDAFLSPGALSRAVQHMEATPGCALGGGRLIGRDGSWQPSARMFHSLWRDASVLTGLAARFPKSRLCGGLDRTWADWSVGCEVDWVPGAFSIVRSSALKQVGVFDPAFFLYYEEVDLCVRLKQAGYSIWYWPDVVITHLGGESSRQLKDMAFSSQAAQVVLWRMRSTLLFYRKHHGGQALLAKWLEKLLYRASMLRNRLSNEQWRVTRQRNSSKLMQLMDQAWRETEGGRVSPPRPW